MSGNVEGHSLPPAENKNNNGEPMNKTRIILFLAELAAVALLRAVYIFRRDKTLPKSGKVSKIKNKPVYRPFWDRPKEKLDIAGWTPPPQKDKIHDSQQGPPGTKS
jgi:hypothetical protein